jgi:hypothetical protein
MQALRSRLEKSDNSYWADRTEEQMLAVSAWVASRKATRERAEQFMRAAADGEDGSVKHVAMEKQTLPDARALRRAAARDGAARAGVARVRGCAQGLSQPLSDGPSA